MSDWILLLPPSESKATPPKNGMSYESARKKKPLNTFYMIDAHREVVLTALEAAMERGHGLEDIFEVQGESLDDALRLNRACRKAPTLPARDLYNGVLYEALKLKTLPKRQQEVFNKSTLILSGLFGILRPLDRIPPYKLKISSNLGGTVGKIANYWRRPVSEILRIETRNKVVWDFLPDQHRRVWDGTGELRARHTVKFVKRVVHRGVADWKTISHHSKALKGALVRHLLKKNSSDPEALHDFEHPDGYSYSPSLSVRNSRASELVFAAE